MKQKSIIEQALLQVQNLEEAVTKNAKGILASTMRKELSDLIKESMEDEEEKLSNVGTEKDMSEQPMGDEDSENLDNMETDPADDVEADDTEDFEDEGSEDEFGSEEEADDTEDFEDEEAVDMTNATDDEVLKVFKAMKPEDGIIVKKNNGNVEFSDGNDDYIIKLDSEEPMSTGMPSVGSDVDSEIDSMGGIEDEIDSTDDVEDEMFESHGTEEEADETIYEIELDDADEKTEEPKETDVDEAARTFANDVRKPADSGKKYKAGRTTAINEEISKLKKQNNEYKKALLMFKDKINEVAIFNAGLAYSTRLFTEHSTTKQEKIQILERFDSIKSINESKNLYDTIKTELGNKKTITETVVNKITKTPTTSSKDMLTEAKAYENPEFKRIKDLMAKMK